MRIAIHAVDLFQNIPKYLSKLHRLLLMIVCLELMKERRMKVF